MCHQLRLINHWMKRSWWAVRNKQGWVRVRLWLWEREVEAKSSLCKYIREQCPLPYINVMTFRQEPPHHPLLLEGEIAKCSTPRGFCLHNICRSTQENVALCKDIQSAKEQHKTCHEQHSALIIPWLCEDEAMWRTNTHSSPTHTQSVYTNKFVVIFIDSFNPCVIWVIRFEGCVISLCWIGGGTSAEE